MTIARLAAIVLLYPALAAAQQAPVAAPLQLYPSRYVSSAALASGSIVTTGFASSSFLVQLSVPVAPSSPDPAIPDTVIHRIAFDASSDLQFDLKSVPPPQALAASSPSIAAFALAPSGDVFVLTLWKSTAAADDQAPDTSTQVANLVHFDPLGNFVEIVAIDQRAASANQLACFSDGKFALITNAESSADLIILSGTGDFIATTHFSKRTTGASHSPQPPDSGSATQPDQLGSPAATPADQPSDPADDQKLTFLWTDPEMAASPDDNVIVIALPDQPGKVLKVAGDGTIQELPLEPAVSSTTTSATLALSRMTLVQGRLVLFYVQKDSAPDTQTPITNLIMIYDLATGHLIATCTGDPAIMGTNPVGWDTTGSYYLRYNKDLTPPGLEVAYSTP